MNLNHYITIQRQASTQDAVGQQVDTWTDLWSGWSSIAPVSGREYFNASGERAEVTHKIKRRFGGVSPAPVDRVVFGSRTFDIRSVINIEERGRYLELMCTELVR